MSYLLKVQGNDSQYIYSRRECPYFSKFIENNSDLIFFQGEFHSTIKELQGIDWISDPTSLSEIDAPFTIVKLNKKDDEVYFASSIFGVIQMYYYHEKGCFIISDDFWEIVNQISIDFDSLDIESIREYLAVGQPLFDGTYIKGLKIVNSGMTGFYEKKNDKLSIKRYYNFSIVEKEWTLEQATEKLDDAINKGMQRIRAEMGNVRYTMGLSGGLDSRLIPHYAINNGMNVDSYILGDPKPRKVFLSRDHRNSRKLAKIFGLKHKECNWNLDVFKDALFNDIKNAPLLNQQFFKGRIDIDFDVLLTGGSGYWVGSCLPVNLQELDEETLVKEMNKLFRGINPSNEDLRLINAALRVLFGKEIKNRKEIPWISNILDETTDMRVKDKIKWFVKERKQIGKDNLSIFFEWFDFYGARNIFGGYESLNGRVRAFSIYVPHVLKTVINWKYKFFQDRLCLKNLILNYVPEAANVKEQKFEGKIGHKTNFLNKLFNGFLFWLFGNGNDIVFCKFKYVEKYFYKRMTNKYEWFYEIFDIRNNIEEIMRFKGKAFLTEIWKHKIILDLLETGGYRKFLNSEKMKKVGR